MPLFQERPELLSLFRSGDRGALEVVYRRYAPDVLRFLRAGFVSGSARVRGITDAQTLLDTAQEVFVRAFGEAGRTGYDGARPYRPYVLRIAQNLRIDHARKSGREVRLDDGEARGLFDVEELLASSEAVPAGPDSAEWFELRGAVRAYVGGLDAEHRRFVELRFDDELGQVEIAECMGVTRRRIRTLEASVLSGLRRELQRRGLP